MTQASIIFLTSLLPCPSPCLFSGLLTFFFPFRLIFGAPDGRKPERGSLDDGEVERCAFSFFLSFFLSLCCDVDERKNWEGEGG